VTNDPAGSDVPRSRYPEILAKVARIEKRRSSWTKAATKILFLALLFTLLRDAPWAAGETAAWQTAALLLAVVAFHELCHFLAMRIVRYRNVDAFFVPFLGSAVNAPSYDVPGYKRAIVALMGPLTGLALGFGLVAPASVCVCGGTFNATNSQVLIQAVAALLAFNGFCLLPVLPLDGGAVLDAVLFSRHRWLEPLSRVAVIAVLVGLGVRSDEELFFLFGALVAVSLPVSVKMWRVTRRLRRSERQWVSADGRTVPATVAEEIIERGGLKLRSGSSDARAARFVLRVFGVLNARPAGLLASLLLVLLYVPVLLVILALGALALHDLEGRALERPMAPPPPMQVDPDAIEADRAASVPGVSRETVVANFTSARRAYEAFNALRRPGPARVALRLFGQSVFVSLPLGNTAARQAWMSELSRRTSTVFIASSETTARARLTFAAPQNDALWIEQQMTTYFLAGGMHLVPPWQMSVAGTADETRQLRARQTYARLAQDPLDLGLYSDVDSLTAALADAERRGDADRASRLRTEISEAKARAYDSHSGWRSSQPDTDMAVVALHKRLFPLDTLKWDRQRLVAEMGPLLGQIELVEGAPKPGSPRLAATGTVWTEEGGGVYDRLSAQFLRFDDPSEGLAAMVRWLHAQGCVDFRYDFVSGDEPKRLGFDDLVNMVRGRRVSDEMRAILEKHQRMKWDLDVSSLPVEPGNSEPPRAGSEFWVLAPRHCIDCFKYRVVLNRPTGSYWIVRSGGNRPEYTVFGPATVRAAGGTGQHDNEVTATVKDAGVGEATSTVDAAPPPASTVGLHNPCSSDRKCNRGQKCSFWGDFAGRGHRTCEIVCDPDGGKETCPPPLQCGVVYDGPGARPGSCSEVPEHR
jgi:Zn-dependent protease